MQVFSSTQISITILSWANPYYLVLRYFNDIICYSLNLHIDRLSISATSPTGNRLTVGEGETARFTAIASGINMNKFVYLWKKRDSSSISNKASGINETVLIISTAIDSDEGQYYCTVTNEWGRSVESDDVTLIVTGTQM